MTATLTTLNEFNRPYLKSLISDVSEEELDLQPQPELHSIRWILAHLCIAIDYGLKQFDLPFVCSLRWHAAYGPTSAPGTSAKIRPTRDELLQTIDSGYTLLCDAMARATLEEMTLVHEVDLLKATPLKTRGDLVGHILTTHFATHLGQLSSLRRHFGRPPLF